MKFVKTPDPIALMDWGAFPEKDEDCFDYDVATWAVDQLKKPPKAPFFLAVGFQHPHVPCYAPQKWFDLYPEDKLTLPEVKADDRDDLPRFASYLHWKLPEPRLKWLQENNQWKPLVRAYLASVSFVDSQVGRVLDGLAAAGLEKNTIVVLWSDHGWHLGEKGITGKNTLWERSTRVPLIFAGPGIAAGREVHAAGGTARPLPDAPRTLRASRRTGSMRAEPRSATEGREGGPRAPGRDDAQPRQPRGAHRSVALHSLCRRQRGTLR